MGWLFLCFILERKSGIIFSYSYLGVALHYGRVA